LRYQDSTSAVDIVLSTMAGRLILLNFGWTFDFAWRMGVKTLGAVLSRLVTLVATGLPEKVGKEH
jgi:hypothetical protein